jgi:streptogramin lyase
MSNSILFVLALCAPAAAAPPFAPNALFVADATDGAVHRLAADCSVAESYTAGGELAGATDLRFGIDGSLFVACGDRIVEIDSNGAALKSYGEAAGLAGIDAFELGPDGHFFVTCAPQDRVVELDAEGVFVREYGTAGQVDDPRGIAIGPTGNVFVASFASDEIYEFAPGGSLVREFGSNAGLNGPGRIAFGPRGYLFVASTLSGRIVAFDGVTPTATFGSEATLSGDLALAFGPDDRMYVAESGSGDLFSFGDDFAVVAAWPARSLAPCGLAFAPFRFEGRLDGVIAKPGTAKKKTSESIEIAIWPGSGLVMIKFETDPGTKTLAHATSSAPIVCGGFVIRGDDAAKFRAIEGVQVTSPAPQRGTASVALRARGKLDGLGRFVAKEIEGTLHRSAGSFVFSGEITTLGPAD